MGCFFVLVNLLGWVGFSYSLIIFLLFSIILVMFSWFVLFYILLYIYVFFKKQKTKNT